MMIVCPKCPKCGKPRTKMVQVLSYAFECEKHGHYADEVTFLRDQLAATMAFVRSVRSWVGCPGFDRYAREALTALDRELKRIEDGDLPRFWSLPVNPER